MAYRQANDKNNRLTFAPYPTVTLLDARAKRTAARKLLVDGLDPAQTKPLDKAEREKVFAGVFEIARWSAWRWQPISRQVTSLSDRKQMAILVRIAMNMG